jgi:uncharacterized protein (DUF983 family)
MQDRDAVDTELEPRPFGRALARGFAGRCPNCGSGRMFASFLAVNAHCPVCREALHHHRADDLPPYLNIFLTGHVVVGGLLAAMTLTGKSAGSLAPAAFAAAIGMPAALMRPLKGAVVAAQWAMRMHGFGGHED